MDKKILPIAIGIGLITLIIVACNTISNNYQSELKKYINHEYGFEIKYPANYNLSTSVSEIGLMMEIYSNWSGCVSSNSQDCWYIYVFEKTNIDNSDYNYYARPYFELFRFHKDRVITDFTLDGIKGKKVQIAIESPADIIPYNPHAETKVVHYIENDNLAYFFEYMNKGKPREYDDSRFNQMLSTFRITQRDITTEQNCINSGGKISTMTCCAGISNLPNLCEINCYSCNNRNYYKTKICDCGQDKCFNGNKCVPLWDVSLEYYGNTSSYSETEKSTLKDVIISEFFYSKDGEKCRWLHNDLIIDELKRDNTSYISAIITCNCTLQPSQNSICTGEKRYILSKYESLWKVVSSENISWE